MTKSELIMQVSKSTGVDSNNVRAVIEATMDRIQDSMVQGKNLYLRGFGSFVLVRRAAKIARDIQRGTEMKLSETIIPKFKPAKDFKERVRQSNSARRK
nr:MAG TPA: DNA binding protein [Caudoviricetes sp.]